MHRSLVVSLALLAMVGAPAAAQTCQGLASFSTGQMQTTANATFGNGMDTFGATIGYGQPGSAFGSFGVGTTSIDAFSASSFDVGVAGGYQMTAGKAKKIALCPVANFGFGMGPKNVGGSGVDMSRTMGGMGVTLGTSLPGSPQMQIVPTGGLGLAYLKVKADNGTTSNSASDTYGLLNLGVGFVFSSQIAIRPLISIPLGLNGGETTFGLTGSYNFGKKGGSSGRRR